MKQSFIIFSVKILIIYVWNCVWCTCTCSVDPCTYVPVSVPRPGEIVKWSTPPFCAILWKWSLTESGGRLVPNKLEPPSCSYDTGLLVHVAMPCLLYGCWGLELRSSCLYSKHLHPLSHPPSSWSKALLVSFAAKCQNLIQGKTGNRGFIHLKIAEIACLCFPMHSPHSQEYVSLSGCMSHSHVSLVAACLLLPPALLALLLKRPSSVATEDLGLDHVPCHVISNQSSAREEEHAFWPGRPLVWLMSSSADTWEGSVLFLSEENRVSVVVRGRELCSVCSLTNWGWWCKLGI